MSDSQIEKLQALRPKETYRAATKVGYFLAVRDGIAALQPSASMGADEPKGISSQVGYMPPSVDEPCPAPAKPSDISVVEDAVRSHIFGCMPNQMSDEDAACISRNALKAIRPYLRTPEPVSISEIASRLYQNTQHDFEDLKMILRVAYDAAGVPYVE